MLQKKIIMIDDDPDHLLICRQILEKQHFDVLLFPACDSLDNLVDDVKTFQPDLIFIDHEMPMICGEDATKALKASKDTKQVPVVYFTARENIIELAQKAGADDFIRKPFTRDKLLEMAHKYTDAHAA